MINLSTGSCQTPSWRAELIAAVSDPLQLLGLLNVDAQAMPRLPVAGRFSLRVPLSFVKRMRRCDPHDPLLRQVWPCHEEHAPQPGFSADPVGDLRAMPIPGVVHKYAGRVLLIITGACAIHCRYCFRAHFPYHEAVVRPRRWEPALEYVAARPDITEVILSGGDPLVIPDDRLSGLARAISHIPHVRRLRIHTRLPALIPSRIDDALLAWLSGTRLKTVMVLHVNHANEVDEGLREALQRVRDAGATLLNQAVLLRGVNDSADSLVALSEVLFDAGVAPYYLHLLDRVQGAAHFEVPEQEAITLLRQVSSRLPGYLVPRLARETAGAAAKTVVGT